MARTLALVTGSSQGIGLAVAKSLANDHDYHVILGVRNIESGEKVAAELREKGREISTVKLDLTSQSSIAAAISDIETRFGYIDVLVNNAAILLDVDKSLSTWDLFTKTFTTNVIGTATLTEGLLPLLRKAKAPPMRIVCVMSNMGSLEFATDKNFVAYNIDYKAYDASKAALNMLMLNYARILEDEGGKVNSVCPGLVKSNLTRWIEYGHSPEIGAQRIVEMATVGKDGPTRTFSDRNGPIPW